MVLVCYISYRRYIELQFHYGYFFNNIKMNSFMNFIILVTCCVNKCYSQNFASPCPSIFNYAYENSQWVGLMDLPGPRIGQSLYLRVELSLAAQVPTEYPGHIELVASTADTLLDITQGKPVRYRVRFPVLDPIPLVTSIVIDNRVICSGPPATGNVLTTIQLDHTLITKRTGGSSGESGANAHVNYPYPSYQSHSQPMQTQYTQQPNHAQFPYPSTQPSTNHWANVQTQHTLPQVFTSQPTYSAPPKTTETMVSPQQNILAELNQICGTIPPKINQLIVRGNLTDRGDWPWLVPVFLSGGQADLNFICSGTLVTRRSVITAAHCIYEEGGNKQLTNDRIILSPGKFNIRKWTEGKFMGTSQIIPHPEYNPSNKNGPDIAIIVMEESVEFSAYIRPLCIWQEPSDIQSIVNLRAIVVGWGKDESDQQSTPTPRLAKVPIVDHRTCHNSGELFQKYATERTFCAGARDGTGPCNGDSGGGLYLRQNNHWALRGIVSLSISDQVERICDSTAYTIYTDVPKFSKWIYQNIV